MSKSEHTSIYWEWDAEACVMRPLPRFLERAKKQFADKGFYRLEVHESRTSGAHNHYFASLNAAWKNLPENIQSRFPTMEHLRKWLLIKCGYYATAAVTCASVRDANALIAQVKGYDPHAVIIVQGTVVVIHTAQSQSHASMDKSTFQKSKRAVLDEAAALIGVTTDELMASGKRYPDYDDYQGYGT